MISSKASRGARHKLTLASARWYRMVIQRRLLEKDPVGSQDERSKHLSGRRRTKPPRPCSASATTLLSSRAAPIAQAFCGPPTPFHPYQLEPVPRALPGQPPRSTTCSAGPATWRGGSDARICLSSRRWPKGDHDLDRIPRPELARLRSAFTTAIRDVISRGTKKAATIGLGGTPGAPFETAHPQRARVPLLQWWCPRFKAVTSHIADPV